MRKATIPSDANIRQIKRGAHYKRLTPQPWDVMLSWQLNGVESLALKYLARWRHDGGKGVRDLECVIDCCNKLIEVERGK